MKRVLFLCCFLLVGLVYAQVGIGTITPSPNASLEVSGEIRANQYGGLILPRLSITERDAIPVTADDDGMIIYLIDGTNRFIQVYNAATLAWETIYPMEFSLSTPLVGWDFNGLTNFGTSPLLPSTLNAAVSAVGLTRAPGVTTSGSAPANVFGGNGFDATDFATALTDENYVYFSITPSVGRTVSLKAINPYNIRRSGTGPTTGRWQYSIDGSTYNDILSDINWGPDISAGGNDQTMIDLSGISALQNLTSATTVTFRVVNWGGAVGGNWGFNGVFSGDDLIIIGDVR